MKLNKINNFQNEPKIININNDKDNNIFVNNIGIKIKKIVSHKNPFSADYNTGNNDNYLKEQINEINTQNNDNNDNNIKNKIKLLSLREKSFYILSQSTVLRLCERLIFAKSTSKLRSMISINSILVSNELFIQEKIKSLTQELDSYNKMIEKPFTPSKSAEITLNFIKDKDEIDFKNSFYLNQNKTIKYIYYNYGKILLYLMNHKLIEINEEDNIIKLLYQNLNSIGYQNFKDYLYDLFFGKNSGGRMIGKYNNFEELKDRWPNLIENVDEIKINKFISFSYFLIKEFIDYGIKIKEILCLKKEIE